MGLEGMIHNSERHNTLETKLKNRVLLKEAMQKNLATESTYFEKAEVKSTKIRNGSKSG